MFYISLSPLIFTEEYSPGCTKMKDVIIICGLERVLCPEIYDKNTKPGNQDEIRLAASKVVPFSWIQEKNEMFTGAEQVYFVTARAPWLIDVSILWLYQRLPWLDSFEIIHLDFENPRQKKSDKIKKIEIICESYEAATVVIFDDDARFIKNLKEKYPDIISFLVEGGRIVP